MHFLPQWVSQPWWKDTQETVCLGKLLAYRDDQLEPQTLWETVRKTRPRFHHFVNRYGSSFVLASYVKMPKNQQAATDPTAKLVLQLAIKCTLYLTSESLRNFTYKNTAFLRWMYITSVGIIFSTTHWQGTAASQPRHPKGPCAGTAAPLEGGLALPQSNLTRKTPPNLQLFFMKSPVILMH